jgi:hypothetical protein
MRYLLIIYLVIPSWVFAAIGVTDIKNTTTLTDCDGSATAYAHGNAGPFTYAWSTEKLELVLFP